MAKINKNKHDSTQTNEAKNETNEPEVKNETNDVKNETNEPVAAATATELATVASAELGAVAEELIDDGVTAQHLIQILPHKAKKLRRQRIPTEQEYEKARAALNTKSQARFDDLMERLSPEKSGFETGSKAFRPQTIKLKQGTTNDENCPEACDSGGLYTSDGIVLTAPTEARAKKGGVSTNLYVVVVSGWKGRALFAPRVAGKVVPLKEFEGVNDSFPYCRSLDRVVGAPAKNVPGIGRCDQCPYKPWKVQGEPNLCNDSVTAIFVLLRKEDDGSFTPFDGLYEMTFSKSATPCGNHIQALAEKGNEMWERVLRISVKEEKGKEGVYYIPEAFGVTNDENGRPLTVRREEAAVLKMLHDQLAVTYYHPSLAQIYRREEQLRTGGGNTAASKPKSDMSELERRAAEAAGETSRGPADMRDANV